VWRQFFWRDCTHCGVIAAFHTKPVATELRGRPIIDLEPVDYEWILANSLDGLAHLKDALTK
jgi:hypothetical protein